MMGLTAPAWGLTAAGALLVVGIASLLFFMTRGWLTLDLGWGRTLRPVGPIVSRIEAPGQLVFESDGLADRMLELAERSTAGSPKAPEVRVRGSGGDVANAAAHARAGLRLDPARSRCLRGGALWCGSGSPCARCVDIDGRRTRATLGQSSICLSQHTDEHRPTDRPRILIESNIVSRRVRGSILGG
jgi:hypothetical protein